MRRIISESNKLIDVKMTATDQITDYIESMSLLQRAIRQYYSEESQKVQIMVVMHHLGKKLRQDGNVIYDEFEETHQDERSLEISEAASYAAIQSAGMRTV